MYYACYLGSIPINAGPIPKKDELKERPMYKMHRICTDEPGYLRNYAEIYCMAIRILQWDDRYILMINYTQI